MLNWFYSLFGVRIQLTSKDIIFGIGNVYNDKIIMYLNFVILITKYYIYVHKLKKQQIAWSDCIPDIQKEVSMAEQCARMNNRFKKFKDDWNDFTTLIVPHSNHC